MNLLYPPPHPCQLPALTFLVESLYYCIINITVCLINLFEKQVDTTANSFNYISQT